MKVAFVQCPAYGIDTPPLGIAYLSSFLRSKGYETKVFDFNIELYNKSKNKDLWEFWKTHIWIDKKKIFKNFPKKNTSRWAKQILRYNPDAICFSTHLTSILFSIELAKRIKKVSETKPIILGGPACFKGCNKFMNDTGINQGIYKYVDIIVTGEGEEILFEILNRFKKQNNITICYGTPIKKRIRLFEQKKSINNLDLLPIPNYKEFDLKKYRNCRKGEFSILTSRGCLNKCAFCTDNLLWKKYRTRSSKSILKEFKLRAEQGFKFIEFNDSTMNGDLKVMSDLCDKLIKENINLNWGGSARIDPKMNFKLLRKMKKAGCMFLNYGIESASNKVLKKMNKQITVKDISKIIIKTRLAGINVYTNWIVGFPNETRFDFLKTLLFIIFHRIFINELAIGRCFINPASLMETNPKKFNMKYDKKRNWYTTDKKNTLNKRVRRLNTLLLICKLFGYKVKSIVKHDNKISNIVLQSKTRR